MLLQKAKFIIALYYIGASCFPAIMLITVFGKSLFWAQRQQQYVQFHLEMANQVEHFIIIIIIVIIIVIVYVIGEYSRGKEIIVLTRDTVLVSSFDVKMTNYVRLIKPLDCRDILRHCHLGCQI